MKPSKRMLGDKAYDSAELREELHERGTKPVIPNRSNRKQPFRFSRRLYKLRWRIEAAFNRLKDFRRIATRYDRLARNYLASVCLAAALVWWVNEFPTLALQLHFLLEVRSLCFGLVSASPERPCDDASGLDTPLRELEGDTTDFLDRPADQERRLIDRRGNVFLGPTTAALAR